MTEIINGLHLDQLIAKVSEQIGVAVDQLYTILMNQAKVQLIWDSIYCVAFVLFSIAVFVAFKKAYKKYKESDNYDDEEHYAVKSILIGMIGGILFLFGLVFFIEGIREIVQIIVNPPVWIFDFIMQYAK